MTSRVLFAVDYEQKPFCIVRAEDFRHAITLAAGLMVMPVEGTDEWRPAAPNEVAKLRARRPTDRERYAFAVENAKFGAGGEVELAAVPLG
jgi:hypothetical protein